MEGLTLSRGHHQCLVRVTKEHLKCNCKTSFRARSTMTIDLDDILAVQIKRRGKKKNDDVFILYSRTEKRKKALRWEKLDLSGDPKICEELVNVFSRQLAERLRVKHYFVIINPKGGRKRGAKIFRKKIEPLFRACSAKYEVYKTKGPEDVRNGVRNLDLRKLDGVIVIGGDGFYSDVITALILHQQKAAGLNPDNPDSRVQPLPCPVGIIPAGTGNYLAFYQHGVIDPIHSAIKIIKGEKVIANLVSIHQGGHLERYGSLLAHFGLFGEIIHLCERYRCLGKLRYKFLPLKAIYGRRLIDIKLEYQKENSIGKWHSMKEQVYGLRLGVVVLADNGKRLVPKFGQKAMSLHIVTACPLCQHIAQLQKLEKLQTGAYNFDFIQAERVKKYIVSLDSQPTVTRKSGEIFLRNPFYMNVDGELVVINRPEFQVGLHRRVVSLLG